MKSPPDGYTLNIITPSWSINPALYPMKYDPANDYTPILMVARGPFVIVVHPSLPARNTRELVALAKANPGGITYGSSGQGAIVHLATVAESGVPGYEVTNWHGFIGPKGLPRPIVDRLNADMNKIVKAKD